MSELRDLHHRLVAYALAAIVGTVARCVPGVAPWHVILAAAVALAYRRTEGA